MKILVACFSLTGKTELIAKKLAKSLGADYVSLEPVKWKSKFAAYTVGLLLAQRRRAVEILPLEDVDVDSYDCVVVSGPVWGGAPAPVLNGFIRQYQLEGKQTYGLLSCGLEGKSASKLLRAELEAAGTRCRSVITVKAENETLEALEKGKIEFLMRENGKIILQVSEKHRRKKNLTENQVQEMRELIEASETDDSVKKSASAPEKENVSPEGQTEEKTDNPKTQAAEGDGAHGDEPRTEEPAQPAPAGKKAEKGPSKTEEPPVPAEKQAAEGDGAHGDEPPSPGRRSRLSPRPPGKRRKRDRLKQKNLPPRRRSRPPKETAPMGTSPGQRSRPGPRPPGKRRKGDRLKQKNLPSRRRSRPPKETAPMGMSPGRRSRLSPRLPGKRRKGDRLKQKNLPSRRRSRPPKETAPMGMSPGRGSRLSPRPPERRQAGGLRKESSRKPAQCRKK